MFESLEVENFQSHKKTKIEFSPGVNTIIGTSDRGKSALIRSMVLVSTNKPDGTDYVSDWLTNEKGKIKGNSKSTIVTTDGYTVSRVRGELNQYEIKTSDEDAVVLKAFGRGSVPDDITEILNLSDINIQKQEDNFFLLGVSSTEVVKAINSFVNLELIDIVASNGHTAYVRNNREQAVAVSQIEDVDSKLLGFEVIDALDPMLLSIEEEFDSLVQKKVTIVSLTEIVDKIKNIKESLLIYRNLERVDRMVTLAVQQQNEIREIKAKTQRIQDLLTQYKLLKAQYIVIPGTLESEIQEAKNVSDKLLSVQTRINKIQEILAQISRIKLEIDNSRLLAEAEINDCFGIQNGIVKKKETITRIQGLIDSAKRIKQNITILSQSIAIKEEEFKKIMPDVCPLCGSVHEREV